MAIQTNETKKIGKARILIIGCGDVGGRLLPMLTPTHQVFVLTSQPQKAILLRQLGVIPIVGDLDQLHSLKRLTSLASTVIHLAPPNSYGNKDLRTQNLIRILSQARGVRRFIYISTSGVYGDCEGAWVGEERTPSPMNDRARRRVNAESQIRAWAIKQNIAATILRVPGIYAQNRLPLERIRNATPILKEECDIYTNHIHADDLARIIQIAVYRGAPQRIFNASDESYLKMGQYMEKVATKFGLPLPPRVDFQGLKDQVSPMALSIMSESRRLKSKRLHEMGIKLYFPHVDDFLKTI
ncbi:MAG: SDR family oxidoreductase [Betaproteobacteria bacterium]|jgi:nucleoside-diphosphate-sugar epimerase